MSQVTEAELKIYRKQIKQAITASSKEKRIILQGLFNGIDEYTEQHPNTSLGDLHAHFGTPSEIAAEYISEVTPKEVKRFSRRKKVILGLLVVLVMCIALFAIIYWCAVEESPGIIKESEKFVESNANPIIVENY